jgi:hypothetical protein
MNIQWNPNAMRDIEKMALDNLYEQRRGVVHTVECPEHHLHPDLVRDSSGLWLSACCARSAELAAEAAGLGDIDWKPTS